MSEESKMAAVEAAVEAGGDAIEAGYTPMTQLGASSMVIIENTLERFIQTADVSAVYAEPMRHGDLVIIPAAEVVCAMGFGTGAGNGPEMDHSPAPGGAGGGGGGSVLSRPAAVIVSGPHGVDVKPVLDLTKIILAGLTALGFMLSTIAAMRRGK